MVITWLGLSCFRLQMKSAGVDVTLVTDPYDPTKSGLRLPRSLSADIVTVSLPDPLHGYASAVSGSENGKLFAIEGPGEYEVGGVFVTGTRVGEKLASTVYRIAAEEMRLVHLGALAATLTEEEIERLGDVDILFVSVAGAGEFSPKQMAGVVAAIEPRVVIPMQYDTPGLKVSLPKPDVFLKELGASKVSPEEKVRLTRKELPEGETRVILLAAGG